MLTSELDFELPDELVAPEPVAERDAARLLVVSRTDPTRREHLRVRDLPSVLPARSLMVFNTTRVLHARFTGVNRATGGRVEGLYLHDSEEPGDWVVMLKARRHRPGAIIEVDGSGGRGLELIGPADEPGAWLVRSSESTNENWLLDAGEPPLPPYIVAARKRRGLNARSERDTGRYQTVYADQDGSVAAPTAGLHFTPELLERLSESGISRADVLLHVGRGTFQPVETDRLEDHPMHEEWCGVTPDASAQINAAREGARPVVAVGTTTARTLESFADEQGVVGSGRMSTRLLISPGYRWRAVDAMMTNFHLPRSTLLAMVSSLFDGGIGRLREIYADAIEREYRFFSYGDSMLILP